MLALKIGGRQFDTKWRYLDLKPTNQEYKDRFYYVALKFRSFFILV